ncbi:MAG: 50S ribosomal protein L2 [Candidatus Colwellbacteria bacterium]|nr:50S ribosomal protein L2 [Candidatus Colwellbacteria bacterium]
MKRYKPYTPVRRKMTTVDYSGLTKARPMKQALRTLKRRVGRNSSGRITTRHKGGGAKRRYRLIDLKQLDKMGVPGRVESIEYDPNRSAFIMKVLYADGDRRYLLAPKDVSVDSSVLAAEAAPLKTGNRMMLKNIPVGYAVHNVELQRGRGGAIIRSAGSEAQVLAQEGIYAHLKLPSGEVRRVIATNFASLGQVSNPDHNLVVVGKAGRKRKMGIRPTVRGSAMNPVDHPYGGGEGKQRRGTKRPKDIWGNVTGGHRTRNKKKWSNKMIVKRRVKKKKK